MRTCAATHATAGSYEIVGATDQLVASPFGLSQSGVNPALLSGRPCIRVPKPTGPFKDLTAKRWPDHRFMPGPAAGPGWTATSACPRPSGAPRGGTGAGRGTVRGTAPGCRRTWTGTSEWVAGSEVLCGSDACCQAIGHNGCHPGRDAWAWQPLCCSDLRVSATCHPSQVGSTANHHTSLEAVPAALT